MGRRRSSANLKKNFEKGDSYVGGPLDENKMESQGKEINIMPGDDEKIPVIPETETAVLAMFTQVPTDSEIKELLKGKTAKEKRALLREIEKAKQ